MRIVRPRRPTLEPRRPLRFWWFEKPVRNGKGRSRKKLDAFAARPIDMTPRLKKP